MSLISAVAKLATRPQGPVEQALFDHIWQQTPVETVLKALMQSEVFFYAQGGGANPQPLVTQGDGGGPIMLVFTSQARAAAIAKQLPAESKGQQAPFKDMLRWAPIELGLGINTGSALAAECTPAHLDALRREAGIFRP